MNVKEAVERQTRSCGSCKGSGTAGRYYQDGSFEPVDCDICHGFGYAVVDSRGDSRDPMGRFCGV